MVSSIFAGLLAITSIASALPQATTPGSRSCAQIGSGNKDGQYTVTCGADRPGGDLSNAQSSSFEGCIPQCDALVGCVGFAYVGESGSGVCYFKSSLTDQVSASNVDVAVKPVVASSSSAPASTSAPFSTPVQVPTTSASVPATPTNTVAASCSQLGASTQGYTTECATDRAGGDLGNAQASSFSGCIPICDSTPGCVGFSYVGGANAGTCYLKSSLTAPSANSNVDTAYKNGALSSSSSSSSVASSTTSSKISTTTSAAPRTTTSKSRTSSAAPSTTSKATVAPSTTSSVLPIITVTVLPGVPVPTFSIPGFPYTVTTVSIIFPTLSVPTLSIPTFTTPTLSIPTFSAPTLSIPTTLATSTKAATTSAQPTTTSAPPASTPTQGLFCTKYVFGFPVVVLCSTLVF